MSDAVSDDGERRDADHEAPAARNRVRWGRVLLVFGPLALLALYAARRPLLTALPPLLVARDEPRAADALVVLAGDAYGRRVQHGVELWRRGLVAEGPFVTTGGVLYDELSWAKVARAHAVRLGVPAERVLALDQGETTAEEARRAIDVLAARGVKTVLLVTSPYHSGRAAALFRAEATPRGIEVLSCPSQDEAPEAWWEDPVATRYVVTELLKRIY